MTSGPACSFAAAIFDMDGLLIDSEQAIMSAWIEAARSIGVNLAVADYLRVVGIADRESDAILAPLLGGQEAFRRCAAAARSLLGAGSSEPVFGLKPGAAELVRALRARHVACAVASSSRGEAVRHRLGGVGLLDPFDAIAAGDEVPRGKPDPALYALAATRLGIEPARCLAFEDSDHGAAAALAAGVNVVVVPDLVSPSPAVAVRSLAVLGSLHDALEHLPRWFVAPDARR